MVQAGGRAVEKEDSQSQRMKKEVTEVAQSLFLRGRIREALTQSVWGRRTSTISILVNTPITRQHIFTKQILDQTSNGMFLRLVLTQTVRDDEPFPA